VEADSAADLAATLLKDDHPLSTTNPIAPREVTSDIVAKIAAWPRVFFRLNKWLNMA